MRPRSLLAYALLCALGTLAVTAFRPLQFAYENGAMKVALETTATIAAVVTSYLLLGRVQRTRSLDELVLTCGLTALAFSNFVFAGLTAIGSPKTQSVMWEPLIGTAVSACLVAVSSLLPRRRLTLSEGGARRVVLGVATASVGVMLLIVADPHNFLPHAVYAGAPTAAANEPSLVGHPVLVVIQWLLTVTYGIAAIGFGRKSNRTKDELYAWFAVACVLGAAARMNYLTYPSLQPSSLYVGDLVRLGFYIVLLIGAAREIASYWASNVEAAQLEERRRIARDLHDGLAQEIAFIGRNAALLRDEADPELADRIAAAAERARLESRSVIEALTARLDQPLDRALLIAAQEAEERYGASVHVKTPQLVIVPPARREALLRIATEAIANAARHGGAAQVEVEIDRVPDGTRLRVIDHGRGFDPEAGRRPGFGLISMRERAEALGGRFDIHSRPGFGTEVEVVV